MKLPRTLGPFEVIAAIGDGGMGSVFRARDARIGRDVAIKLLREGFDNPELRDRFAREARSAGSLSHPNIVTIYDIGTFEGRPFIAMEYVPGDTFADLIRADAPLPVARKLQMMEEVCAGLAHAHDAGIVHRDIKPANLMVGPEGIVKILDFGIARLDTSAMTQPGTVIGTLNYMSPEQVHGESIDRRTDVFAAGAVLYELLSYRQAFPGDVHQAVLRQIADRAPVPITTYCPDLDPSIARIVERALQKAPTRRFDTADAMRKELTAARRRLSDSARAPRRSSVGAAATPPRDPQSQAQPARPRIDRATLARERAEAIESRLAAVDRAVQSGDDDAAIECCEQVLRLDPGEPRVTAFIDRIHEAIEARQVRTWLAEARERVREGGLAAASDLADDASAVVPRDPDLALVRAEIAQAKARLRGDAVRRACRRARECLAAGDATGAQIFAAEALAIDASDDDAGVLANEIRDAIAARDEDAGVRAAVDQARRSFVSGEHEAARRLLDAQPPAHPAVAAALGDLRTALEAIEQRRREEAEREERRRRAATLLDDARLLVDAEHFEIAVIALDQARELGAPGGEVDALTERARRERAAARDRLR